MLGVIITGHGNFAGGMESAVRLLAGENPAIRAVDFLPDESEEKYRKRLRACLDSLGDCGQIFVLCDILGGTPFKTACLLCREMAQTNILYGVNLPLVLEVCMHVISGNERITESGELIDVARTSIGYMKKAQGNYRQQRTGQKE